MGPMSNLDRRLRALERRLPVPTDGGSSFEDSHEWKRRLELSDAWSAWKFSNGPKPELRDEADRRVWEDHELGFESALKLLEECGGELPVPNVEGG